MPHACHTHDTYVTRMSHACHTHDTRATHMTHTGHTYDTHLTHMNIQTNIQDNTGLFDETNTAAELGRSAGTS